MSSCSSADSSPSARAALMARCGIGSSALTLAASAAPGIGGGDGGTAVGSGGGVLVVGCAGIGGGTPAPRPEGGAALPPAPVATVLFCIDSSAPQTSPAAVSSVPPVSSEPRVP